MDPWLPETKSLCLSTRGKRAYKRLVRPVLEYRPSEWARKSSKLAAIFVTGNYNFETGSMTGILEHLKWESLKKQRRDSRLILLYKGLKGKASVLTADLIPLVRRCRNHHSMAYQVPIANTDIYKRSFSPRLLGIGMYFQTLLSPLLKVPSMVLLSSLLWWELGTSLPGPGEWLSFWRVTSKQFWSDFEVQVRVDKDLVDAKTASAYLSSQNKSLQHKILLCNFVAGKNNRQ